MSIKILARSTEFATGKPLATGRVFFAFAKDPGYQAFSSAPATFRYGHLAEACQLFRTLFGDHDRYTSTTPRNQASGFLTLRNLLARGDIQDGVPHELHEPIQRVLAKAFDIAVPPVLGELGFVETRTNAVGLHALGA